MAQRTGKAISASPIAASRPLAEAAPAERRPRRDFVETVWTLFCSLRFAVVLNVALALAAMLGTVVPQMQPGIQNLLAEYAGDGRTVHLYADRDRWSKLVTFVSHAALVLLIVVAAGMANFGWREQSVFFYPGKPVDVGHGLDFTVRHDKFSIDYYPDGKTVKEYKDT